MLPMNDRPLLYVAAPYTHPDPVMNTNAVCRVAMALYEHTQFVPLVPHLSLLWHAITPRPIDVWYDIDRYYLGACAKFVRLPGPSVGADAETELAEKLGLGVVSFLKPPGLAPEGGD